MYGAYALTRVVYVLLVIAFVAVMAYMVFYNLRMKRREKALEAIGRQMGTSERIAAAAESAHDDRIHRKH
jgi:uncharacterized membrane protein